MVSRFSSNKDFRHTWVKRALTEFYDLWNIWCLYACYEWQRILLFSTWYEWYYMIQTHFEVWLDSYRISVFMDHIRRHLGHRIDMDKARIWLGFGRLREIDYIIWKSGLSVSILWFLIEPDSSVFMICSATIFPFQILFRRFIRKLGFISLKTGQPSVNQTVKISTPTESEHRTP